MELENSLPSQWNSLIHGEKEAPVLHQDPALQWEERRVPEPVESIKGKRVPLTELPCHSL